MGVAWERVWVEGGSSPELFERPNCGKIVADMHRSLLSLVTFYSLTTLCFADDPVIKSPSPDGRFALRVSDPKEEGATPTVELIEKKSGKVIVNLGTSYFSPREGTFLVWSADSKRVAYATRGPKTGDVSVLFWRGSTFESAEMPDVLPNPDIKFDKEAAGGPVKNYGGAPTPLRWLKSGGLLMSNDSVMMSRVNDKTYTGTVTFTLTFDKGHHATVHNVSKTKTTVD
ncbi:MAG TPA: hypothetical protein VK968_12590 [Roseimicrobium sp.]|nr:hypothetical protein [Roseimicrobium sp.]